MLKRPIYLYQIDGIENRFIKELREHLNEKIRLDYKNRINLVTQYKNNLYYPIDKSFKYNNYFALILASIPLTIL
jgi:hypothetical protein